MKTETFKEMRQLGLRDLIMEQLCDYLDLMECHDELTQVDVCYGTARDGYHRTYRILLNLPEKEITLKQPVTDYEKAKEHTPDRGLYPEGRDFDPDRDAIG